MYGTSPYLYPNLRKYKFKNDKTFYLISSDCNNYIIIGLVYNHYFTITIIIKLVAILENGI